MTHETVPPRSRSRARRRPPARRRRLLLAGAALTAVLVAAVLWAAYALGPRFGVHLVPPSPKRYAELAVDQLQTGYDAEGPDWSAARERVLAAGAEAGSYQDVHDEIADAARVAGGRHSSFVPPTEAAERDAAAREDVVLPTVHARDGITTVTLPALEAVPEQQQEQYARAAADGIQAAAGTTCGWIVDLRGNTGGDMWPMLSGVTALLPVGDAMSFRARGGLTTTATVTSDGAGPDGRTAVSVGDRERVTGAPIAVLQDELTASSGEAVVTAFRGLERVESFGVETQGLTSGNAVITLYDGARLTLTQSLYVDRHGVSLEGAPLVPDHPVGADGDEDGAEQPGDPALYRETGARPAPGADEAAAAWLRGRGC